jgi:capsular polysaccharide biosynthesis protein
VFIFADFRSQTLSAELASTKNNFVALLRNEFVIEQALKEVGLEVDVEKFMEKQLLVEPEEDSAWVKLAVTAEKPKMAADMANTLMDKASHSFGELSAGSLTANKEFIEQQLPEVKKELDEAKLALVQFQMESKFGSLDALINEQQSLIIYLKRRQDEALASDDQLTVDMYDKIIATRELELQEFNLLNKKLEAELKENEVMSAKFIRIIPATEPRHPLPRFNIGLLMVGGVVSLAVGVMTAFVLEALGDLSVPDSSDDVIVQEPVLSV